MCHSPSWETERFDQRDIATQKVVLPNQGVVLPNRGAASRPTPALAPDRHPLPWACAGHRSVTEESTGPGDSLDVGCGSGVLGLCALGLGASRVVAVDIKADAIEATRRNAKLNRMDERVEAMLAPLGEIEDVFDVVVANVGRAALVELAPALVSRVSPGGWLAVSGISPSQCSLVGGFIRPLLELGRRTSGEWAVLVLGYRHRRGG
ncbi:MAG: 50S ribosomal protein L11 methyltransferase [Acidimicrobiia bacterium]